MKRKTKVRAKAKRAVTDLTAKKAAKGGDVGTYTVSTHIRRIYSKLG
jgi:DNA-binding CsgD family transcriptional regulator